MRRFAITFYSYIQNIPEMYLYIGGTVIFILAMLSETISGWLINIAIYIFRLGGKHGPVGKELARQMLDAVGETGIQLDETILDTNFRLSFNDIDYQPVTGVLELTEDKAVRSNFSSAGLVVMEVGRALQYRQKSIFIIFKRLLRPFVNLAGFTLLPVSLGAALLPLWVPERMGLQVSNYLSIAAMIMLGILGIYVMLKIPMEMDAARRGIKAMKRTGVFTFGEALVIRIFLGIILMVTMLTTLLVALNFFKQTIGTKTASKD